MMWEQVLCPGSPVDWAPGSPPVPLPLWNRPPLSRGAVGARAPEVQGPLPSRCLGRWARADGPLGQPPAQAAPRGGARTGGRVAGRQSWGPHAHTWVPGPSPDRRFTGGGAEGHVSSLSALAEYLFWGPRGQL